MPDLTREQRIAAATELHDREGCTCDRRYLMSCPRMAAAILRAPKEATATEHPTEQCRSCPAKVIWAVTERDKPMPVDAEPSLEGTVLLEQQGPRLVARVLPAHRAFGRKDLRKSHFATCPDAASWRRSR